MKHLLSCTALAFLLATGSALAAEDAAQPNAAQPDAAAQPNAAQSEAAQPDLAQPNAAQPDGAQSGLAKPDAAQSEAAQPDLAQPNAAPRDQAATTPDQSTSRAEDIATLANGAHPISDYYNQSVTIPATASSAAGTPAMRPMEKLNERSSDSSIAGQ